MPFDVHALVRGAARSVGRVMAARSLRAVDRLGSNVTLFGAPYVENLGRLEIGDDAAISSRPVQTHLVVAPGAVLKVGARVTIGTGAAIAAHVDVEIEDDAQLGAGVVIMDTDFHATKDHAAASEAAAVRIGAGARLGDRVTVLKGSRIGRGARVAAGSVVAGDIPDGAHVAGVPARVSSGSGSASGSASRSGSGSASRSAHAALGRAEVHERTASVVAATFRAPEVSLDDTPATIAGWDSLGSLRLLVALEDAFGVMLPESLVAYPRPVRALGDEIAAQLERAVHV